MKITEFLGACKESIGDRLRFYKPCIKGSIMVAIGIYLTRYDIGVGRLTTNLMFGMLAYFLVALSGVILVEILHIKENPSYQSRISAEKGLILSGILFGVGIGITTLNILIYNLNLLILIIVGILGGIWFVLYFIAIQKQVFKPIYFIFITLIFTMGLFYGGILNVLLIPIFLYLFFASASLLQLSREILKDLTNTDKLLRLKNKKLKDERDDLKNPLIFNLISIGLMIAPVFLGIAEPIRYLYPMIAGIAVISIATLLIWKKKSSYEKINSLLKWAIFIELVAFIFAG